MTATLKTTLQADLTQAIRERDQIGAGTLRMALTAVTNEEVAGKVARALSDDDVVTVLSREAKRRREAATAYEGAGRPELAERELAELQVLQRYLPTPLSDEELDELVTRAVAESGATGMPQLGLVMKAVQPLVAGRADGGRVAASVRRRLSAPNG
jgi:uncharacterized protein YqeY